MRWLSALLPLSVLQVAAPANAQQAPALEKFMAYLTGESEKPDVSVPATFLFSGERGVDTLPLSELKPMLAGCTLAMVQEDYSDPKTLMWTGNCPGGFGRTIKVFLRGTAFEVQDVEVRVSQGLMMLPPAPPAPPLPPSPPTKRD